MNIFVLNLLLAFVWAAAVGEFSTSNLAFGFLVGYAALYLVARQQDRSGYFAKVRLVGGLFVHFVWQLLLSSLRVAYDVITPHDRQRMRPGIVAVPLDVSSDAGLVILANLISATPGTLSLDISADRKVLYVHAMYADDVEGLRRSIKEGFERRLLEILR